MKELKNVRLLFDVTNRASNVLMDTETGVVFSKQQPLQTVPFISKSVERALRYGKLIDVDSVTGVKLPPRIKALHAQIIKTLGIVPISHETSSEDKTSEKNKTPNIDKPTDESKPSNVEAPAEEGKTLNVEEVEKETESKEKLSTRKAKEKAKETTEE